MGRFPIRVDIRLACQPVEEWLMTGSPLRDVDHGILRLEPRVERRVKPRNGRLPRPDAEPAFVTWEPPIYLLEVEQARTRIARRVLRALTVAASGGLAWLAGSAIGAL